MSRSVGDVTAGLDIGTTSVKALVVDGEGRVLARARRAHGVRTPEPDCFEHDVARAWRANVEQALREVRHAAGVPIAAVNVAAMVPSLGAVDRDGAPLTPGLLYGDRRGGEVTGKNPSESGEFVHFLEWCATSAPDAAGYWPAQAVANHTLCGTGAIDTVVAMTTVPLFDFTGWDESIATSAGARVDQLPAIVVGSEPAGEMSDGTLVGGGTVDAFAEQLVAGADDEGDVLVILGTTLITWAVVSEWIEAPGLWTVPHTAPGKVLIGGPSNAGGLFLGFVDRLLGHGVAPDPAGGSEM
ncbi:MAG: FGGY family carbohydrate kinase, partial [Acidimicrobiales bacterium]|nr:FGGY family carbohydrate kinase [Acidimicrobiales bacterium]